MGTMLKLCCIQVLRVVLKVLWVFPVKKEFVLFESFEGRQYSCNPKYLFLHMKERYGEKYRYIWVLNDKSLCPQGCTCVPFLSFRHVFYLCTSACVISNMGIEPFVPKRKGQVFVNTWHGGGAYKSQRIADKREYKDSRAKCRYSMYVRKVRAVITDFFLSSCRAYATVMAETWNAPAGKFIATGLPRNDILFHGEQAAVRARVRERLGIADGTSCILYAPTFRGSNHRKFASVESSLDVGKLAAVCEERFGGKHIVLYREHLGVFGNDHNSDVAIDVSAWQDMQELLLCADVFVTDYSSCMWDFALLKRPGFLFVPDAEQYEHDVGLYTPISDWPFPCARTNEELAALIRGFDAAESARRIDGHFRRLGSFEKGNACAQVCDAIGMGNLLDRG